MLFLPSCLPVSMLEWHGALGLARIEWIFFLFAIIVSYYSIAIIVPCFGFRMRIAHWCFSWFSSAHHESRTFQLLMLLSQQGGWECTRSWKGTQLEELTPTSQRDTPCHLTSCWTGDGATCLGVGNCCSGTGRKLLGRWWDCFKHH